MIDTAPTYLNNPPGGKKKNIAMIVVAFIILAAIIVGGIFLFRQSKKTDQTKVTFVEKKEPTPTEKPKIDKMTVKIQVVNGTGTPGQAGTVVEALKKAGYNPDNIKTANAKEFGTTVTTVSEKTGFEEISLDVKNSLNAVFSEINIDSTKLPDPSEFDIVILTGGKKVEDTSPTSTPSATPTTGSTAPTATSTPSPTLTPAPTTTP